jgi:hypothetical protein
MHHDANRISIFIVQVNFTLPAALNPNLKQHQPAILCSSDRVLLPRSKLARQMTPINHAIANSSSVYIFAKT